MGLGQRRQRLADCRDNLLLKSPCLGHCEGSHVRFTSAIPFSTCNGTYLSRIFARVPAEYSGRRGDVNTYPNSTVVFDEKASEGALREALRAERLAKHFGVGGSRAEVISFRIEDRPGRVIPKVVIYGPDDMADEKLRQVLRMMC